MPKHYRPITASLRSRLLTISALVVLVMSAVVYFPALAIIRVDFLEERAKASQIAALSTEETQDNRLSPQLEREMLRTAGVIAVVVGRSDFTLILGGDVMPEEANAAFDLRGASLGELIFDALDTLDHKGQRIIRVLTDGANPDTRFVEVTMDEEILYAALKARSNSMLTIALIVSLMTGGLVYLSLHLLVVQPMNKMTSAIMRFSSQPEKPIAYLAASERNDEIGIVERELARMQEEIRLALRQKTHLAELGEAVAKINHDLRNILATAQLASDIISRKAEPGIQKTADRLLASIGRAVDLCERTMTHGKAAEPAPKLEDINLHRVVNDVGDTLGLIDREDFAFQLDFDDAFTVYADEAQLHRVMLNLCRNASQALADVETGKRITIGAEKDEEGITHIRVADSGTGIPAAILANLFKAFQIGASKDSSGLGLAISRDIIEAHGGQIGLERTGPEGTIFHISLPPKGDL